MVASNHAKQTRKYRSFLASQPETSSFSDQCFDSLMTDIRKGMKRKKNVKVCR
jgi:hypothetical protein